MAKNGHKPFSRPRHGLARVTLAWHPVCDIRARRVTKADVIAAIRMASAGPVAEGCIGAGTGTRAFDWKGGIGTSSRIPPKPMGGYTVGVLAQTNYSGVLKVAGAPVGQELGRYYLREAEQAYQSGGSIVVRSLGQ